MTQAGPLLENPRESFESPVPIRVTWRRSAHLVVRTLVGLLLIGAAELKAYYRTVGYLDLRSLIASPTLLAILVSVELALGLALLLDVFSVQVWWSVLALFASFACFSAFAVARQAQSCGCLGIVMIDPALMCAVDVTVVGAMLLFPVRRRNG